MYFIESDDETQEQDEYEQGEEIVGSKKYTYSLNKLSSCWVPSSGDG